MTVHRGPGYRWRDRRVEVLLPDVGDGRCHVRVGQCTANVPVADLTWSCTAPRPRTTPCGDCDGCGSR